MTLTDKPAFAAVHLWLILIVAGLLCFLSGCASLPPNTDSPKSFAATDTAGTRLGKSVQLQKIEHPDHSGFVLLSNGLDAFAARLILAQKADSTIDAQYYMIHADMTGALFTDQLVKAAGRGVRVRLLIDDMDLQNRDEGLSVLASHPNIELRIFNPFSRNTLRFSQYISRVGSVTRRMHNKSFTVDNQVTIVGGRNIGNEYFNADPDLAFGDLDLMAIGPVVQQVSDSFDEYWNNSKAYPVDLLRPDLVGAKHLETGLRKLAEYLEQDRVREYVADLTASTLVEKIRNDGLEYAWGEARVFSDNPDKLDSYATTEEHSLVKKMSPFFQDLDNELLIFSPYFVPGKKGTEVFADYSRSGVRVRIITNSLASTDVGLVHAGYAKYRRPLLRAGVELYEVNKKTGKIEREKNHGRTGSMKASLHAKSFVLDRDQVFIGSLNLDPRSVVENTEIGIMLTSESVAEKMAEGFDRVASEACFRLELTTDGDGFEYISWHGYQNGQEHIWNFDPHTSFLRRFGIGLVSFLPIESQL